LRGQRALSKALEGLDARIRSIAAEPGVLEQVSAARSEGRRTLLVTDDPEALLDIRDLEGLFDNVMTTGDALALTAGTGYELIAGPDADPFLREGASQFITPERQPAAAQGATYLKSLRPHQWSKNILVFMPLLASHSLEGAGPVLVAFLAFCLTASSVYILNDLMDLDADRAHARKRNRPLASGALPIGSSLLLSGVLLIAALLLSALFTPPQFLAVLLLYYAITFAYSLSLKRLLVIDVLTLAALYTLRIIGGAEAAALEITEWLLAFSMFLFLSLAAVKRQAELIDQLHSGEKTTAGRAYVVEDLPVLRGMALAGGYAAVLVLALYISSSEVIQLYESPSVLWLLCPVLLYWVSRMVMITHRAQIKDDPIVFAATDRMSQVSVLLCMVFVVWAALL
jgi:4-hydroxybenzoate polyprenyltransferase